MTEQDINAVLNQLPGLTETAKHGVLCHLIRDVADHRGDNAKANLARLLGMVNRPLPVYVSRALAAYLDQGKAHKIGPKGTRLADSFEAHMEAAQWLGEFKRKAKANGDPLTPLDEQTWEALGIRYNTLLKRTGAPFNIIVNALKEGREPTEEEMETVKRQFREKARKQ